MGSRDCFLFCFFNPLCPRLPITTLFFLIVQPQTAWQHPASSRPTLASWLMQIGMGFSRDLQPRFRYCSLLPAMSFVRSAVEFERCCEFSKLQDGHTIDVQKQTIGPTVSNGVRASSFENWLSCLPWAP